MKKEHLDRLAAKYKGVLRCVVVGTYYYTGPNHTKGNKPFELPVVVPLDQAEMALSLIQNEILPKIMPQKFPDFTRLRTAEIKSTAVLAGPPLEENAYIQLMTWDELVSYIRANRFKIDPSVYLGSVTDLREALRTHKQDPEGYKIQEDMARETMAKKQTINDMLEANASFLDEGKDESLLTTLGEI